MLAERRTAPQQQWEPYRTGGTAIGRDGKRMILTAGSVNGCEPRQESRKSRERFESSVSLGRDEIAERGDAAIAGVVAAVHMIVMMRVRGKSRRPLEADRAVAAMMMEAPNTHSNHHYQQES